uniref:Uncharacterized protein n=1 Tax=Myoviridae sp. ctLYR7 TaxID=2827679 RepID=A0A8S5RXJ7_9CAUD|nr:MAG TPA: hypothetical protein [Myoviridae sp. ctLYR7]DAQ81127.1 MAG TPA: hypothetical protein [Caudoviricetes sp.]DAS32742.1 MAG TPA: hypothetical protein [Caudoviricetes sp.]
MARPCDIRFLGQLFRLPLLFYNIDIIVIFVTTFQK